MSSATEAELGALFVNCRKAIPVHHALETMDHKQPPTPIQTYNTTNISHQQHREQTTQINGHETTLAPLPHCTETISPLLAIGPKQLGRLRY